MAKVRALGNNDSPSVAQRNWVDFHWRSRPEAEELDATTLDSVEVRSSFRV